MLNAELIGRSLGRYCSLLRSVSIDGRSREFVDARDSLLSTTELAIAGELQLSAARVEAGELPAEIAKLVAAVAQVPEAEKAWLINPLTLGLGAGAPTWIFLGYEAAYELGEEPNFSLEACLLATLWQVAPAGGFQQHPYLVLRPLPSHAARLRQRGHYWNLIAALTRATDGRWGDLAYLVEMSAVPKREHSPVALQPDRIDFLCDLVRASEAAVLVVAKRAEELEAKERIAASFLRQQALPEGQTVELANGQRKVSTDFIESAGRLVVFTRHLSADVSDELLDGIRGEVQRRLPGDARVQVDQVGGSDGVA